MLLLALAVTIEKRLLPENLPVLGGFALRPCRREHGEQLKLTAVLRPARVMPRHAMYVAVGDSKLVGGLAEDVVEQTVRFGERVTSQFRVAFGLHVVITALIHLDMWVTVFVLDKRRHLAQQHAPAEG